MYLRCVHISKAKGYLCNCGFICRDISKVVEAVKAYRSGDKDEALRLLESSTSQIDSLVCTVDLFEYYLIDCSSLVRIGRNVGHALCSDLWLAHLLNINSPLF